jgi:hypothetical protein
MTYTTMWAYPWDILDDGVGDVTRRMRDDIGLDAVSVATSYHSVEHLRPHTKGARLFSTMDGGVYFQPDADLWRDVSLKPNVAPMAEPRNPLAEICAAAGSAGLKVESWTVCLHNSRLGRENPTACEQNAFGDVYHPHLCPSNPRVREYITTLCRDLATNYDLYAVELESLSFGGYGHFHGHAKVGLEIGAIGRFLMSLCFCDSCRDVGAAANVDMDALARAAREELVAIFEHGSPGIPGKPLLVRDLLAEKAPLATLVDARQAVVTSLTQEVREAVGDTFLVSMQIGDTSVGGWDGDEIAQIADAIELLCYTAKPAVVEAMVSTASSESCQPDDLIVGLSAYTPHTPSPKVLIRNVRQALRLGVRGFSFYNYGIMPERNLAWVRDAVAIINDAD